MQKVRLQMVAECSCTFHQLVLRAWQILPTANSCGKKKGELLAEEHPTIHPNRTDRKRGHRLPFFLKEDEVESCFSSWCMRYNFCIFDPCI